MSARFRDLLFNREPDLSLPAPRPVILRSLSGKGAFRFLLHPSSVRVSFRRDVDNFDSYAAEPTLVEWAKIVDELDAQILGTRLGLLAVPGPVQDAR